MKKKFLKKSAQESESGWIAPGGEHLGKPDAWKDFLGQAQGHEGVARALHAKAIEDHNIQHFARTGKTWVAPGGEHLLTPEARQEFLIRNRGDAKTAQIDHYRTIQQYNALYLRDEQPLGSAGMIAGKKGGTAPDPASVASELRDAYQKPPPKWVIGQGESAADAHKRMIEEDTKYLQNALNVHSEDAKPIVSPEKWNEHGLQNSFAKEKRKLFPFAIWPHNAGLISTKL